MFFKKENGAIFSVDASDKDLVKRCKETFVECDSSGAVVAKKAEVKISKPKKSSKKVKRNFFITIGA